MLLIQLSQQLLILMSSHDEDLTKNNHEKDECVPDTQDVIDHRHVWAISNRATGFFNWFYLFFEFSFLYVWFNSTASFRRWRLLNFRQSGLVGAFLTLSNQVLHHFVIQVKILELVLSLRLSCIVPFLYVLGNPAYIWVHNC
jgi:hypothetical protein